MSQLFIHQTDLYHPHGDPDDHWDLALVYALAQARDLSLAGIVIDYPPPHRVGDPATLAVSQLAYLSGVTATPVLIGTSRAMRQPGDTQADLEAYNRGAADWILSVLRQADVPVTINIVGSCTDVAIAALREPALFAKKCRAVYLNAGSAHPGEAGMLEYNVRLNPLAYAAMFDLPCPLYWCPCWHTTEKREIGMNGSWYAFRQAEILAHLDPRLQNYFLYMLSRSAEPKWLRYMMGPVDAALLAEYSAKPRSMWSTAGILHAAGWVVNASGELVSRGQAGDLLFDFDPVQVRCNAAGETEWERTEAPTNRFILHIRRPEGYAAAMTAAVCGLLSRLK